MHRERFAFARYSTLSASLFLLVFLLILDVGRGDVQKGWFIMGLFALVGFAGVFVASTKRTNIIVSGGLCTLWLTLTGIEQQTNVGSLELIIAQLVSAMLFLSYTAYLVLAHLLRAKKVSADLLSGASAVYLMIGLIWTFLYMIYQLCFPGSFSNVEDGVASLSELTYFSFTTLTTLGYGDIAPQMNVARASAIIEAITGVLYSAILIARLMGIYIAGMMNEKSD